MFGDDCHAQLRKKSNLACGKRANKKLNNI